MRFVPRPRKPRIRTVDEVKRDIADNRKVGEIVLNVPMRE
jgi:hypothetical protein